MNSSFRKIVRSSSEPLILAVYSDDTTTAWRTRYLKGVRKVTVINGKTKIQRPIKILAPISLADDEEFLENCRCVLCPSLREGVFFYSPGML